MTEDERNKMYLEYQVYQSELSNFISFEIFDKTVEETLTLLECISENTYSSSIMNTIDNCIYILTDDFLQATGKTLKNILHCCHSGSFADANILLRKYRDDLFLYLYIIETANNKKGLTNEEIEQINGGNIESMTKEKFLEFCISTNNVILSGTRKDSHDKATDAWFTDNAKRGNFSRFISYGNYLNYLKTNDLIKECIDKFDLKIELERINRVLNNYTHNNGKSFLSDNLITRYHAYENDKAKKLLTEINNDISSVTSCFLCFLILIMPNYIMSSDYMDYLDMGETPPDDSQYWISKGVQDYIDEYVTKIHVGLKHFLQDNNPYGMKIE